MPEGTGDKAPVGFIILVYFVHLLDMWLRYGTFSSIGANTGIWAIFAIPYFIIGWWASQTPAFKLSNKAVITITVISYVLGPALSMIATKIPEFGALKGLLTALLFFSPLWIWATIPHYPRLNVIWVLGWVSLVTALFFSDIRAYAYEQAGYTKDSLPPWASVSYVWNKAVTGAKNMWTVLAGVPKQLTTEVERSIAMAKGDYYTGQVDAAAKKRLGVYLDNFRPAEAATYENIPVTAYATMKAETLDLPLNIKVGCDADGTIAANKILPKDSFEVFTSDQYDIDCIWNAGTLKKGEHQLSMRTEFEFATRAYLKSYMMDRDRLREYRRQNVDPLANVPDKQPVTIYTSGPVRIGMGVGQQPVALGTSGETLPPWRITIENAWEGKILQITGLYLFVPEGLRITETGGVGMTKTDCSVVPEIEACDDSLVDVYTLTAEELAQPVYQNLTVKNIRVYLELASPEQVLGRAPIAVQNFKATVQYRYLLERTTSVSVREVAAS